jgi:phenylacetate-CoA ligase
MIILSGVNVFPSQIEEIVLRTPGVAPHFQLELTKRGRLDQLTVRAEARPSAQADAGARAAAAEAIGRAVKDGVGVSVEVAIVDPDTLERSAGKLQRVKDLRERD